MPKGKKAAKDEWGVPKAYMKGQVWGDVTIREDKRTEIDYKYINLLLVSNSKHIHGSRILLRKSGGTIGTTTGCESYTDFCL